MASKKNAVKKSGAEAKVAESKSKLTAKLGPSVNIVRWLVNPRKGATTQIAELACGHFRALPRAARATMRCNQCRIEKAKGGKVKVLSRFAKVLEATGAKPVVAKAPVKPAKAAKKAKVTVPHIEPKTVKKSKKAAKKAAPKKAAKKAAPKKAAVKKAAAKRVAVPVEPEPERAAVNE